MIFFEEPTLRDALSLLNTDTPNWWSWINPEDGEVYSNVQSNVDGVDVPSESDCNAKLLELKELWDKENADYVIARKNAYPKIAEQLDKLYHDMTADKLDVTGEWYKAVKQVKDDNPK
tara:strand:- start:30 stop:383 length:354 start_codon:yes stop_codon:yes gene_type:complete